MAETDFPTGSGSSQIGGFPVDLTGHAAGDALILDPTNTKIISSASPPGGVDSVSFTAPLSNTGTARAPVGALTGDIALARIATALATGGDPIKGTVLTATTRIDTPSIGTASGTQHVLPSGTAALLAADSSLPAANLTGDIARARMTVGLAAGGDPITGTVLTASTRTETPTIGTAAGTQHALPAGTAALLAADSALPAANLSGDVAQARISVALAAGGVPIAGTVLTASTRTETPTVGTSGATQHALPAGTADILTADSTATVTGKSIDAGQLTGNVLVARIATALAAGGNPITGTIVDATTRMDAPSIGTDSSNQHAFPSGTGALLAAPLTGAQQVWMSGDYGDGSSGSATISGGTTTLTQVMHYTDLTVTSTGILITANYPVYVNGTLTVQASGVIHCDGGNASGSTAGTAPAQKFYLGGNGGTTGQLTTGTNGGTLTSSLGGGSGAGGAGSSGSGGTAGTVTIPPATAFVRTAWFLELGVGMQGSNAILTSGIIKVGIGGASGGGDGSNRGGGGGGSGGYLMIKARHAVIAGSIHANGGNGGNGTATNTGGGGGAGGGVVVIISPDATITGSITATGGNAGNSGGGAGVNGSPGSNGNVFLFGAS